MCVQRYFSRSSAREEQQQYYTIKRHEKLVHASFLHTRLERTDSEQVSQRLAPSGT